MDAQQSCAPSQKSRKAPAVRGCSVGIFVAADTIMGNVVAGHGPGSQSPSSEQWKQYLPGGGVGGGVWPCQFILCDPPKILPLEEPQSPYLWMVGVESPKPFLTPWVWKGQWDRLRRSVRDKADGRIERWEGRVYSAGGAGLGRGTSPERNLGLHCSVLGTEAAWRCHSA